MKLTDAGNTMAPAWLALLALGYSVSNATSDGEVLRAVRGDIELVANDPVSLLGLAALVDVRGQDWQATDAEIDEYVSLFETGDSDD